MDVTGAKESLEMIIRYLAALERSEACVDGNPKILRQMIQLHDFLLFSNCMMLLLFLWERSLQKESCTVKSAKTATLATVLKWGVAVVAVRARVGEQPRSYIFWSFPWWSVLVLMSLRCPPRSF